MTLTRILYALAAVCALSVAWCWATVRPLTALNLLAVKHPDPIGDAFRVGGGVIGLSIVAIAVVLAYRAVRAVRWPKWLSVAFGPGWLLFGLVFIIIANTMGVRPDPLTWGPHIAAGGLMIIAAVADLLAGRRRRSSP